MAAKPQTAAGYSVEATELVERVLLEAWSRLGAFRQHLVLVGGLVPRYLVCQQGAGSWGTPPAHKGTLDVDLAVSLAVGGVDAYQSMRSTLVDTLGFEPGESDRGRKQRHSFVKRIGNVPVILDFLTTTYEGPEDSLMRAIEENLSAIQVEGLGMALQDPLRVEVEGELLEHGRYKTTINVCRAVPFLMLKALALAGRGEPKDAYDLVYVIRYYREGPGSLAAEVRDDERRAASFCHAVDELYRLFKTTAHAGPRKYAAFGTQEPNAEALAYAAVQDFLDALKR